MKNLQRIQAFCDQFELTEDELFSLIGTGVCRMAVITINAGKDDSLYSDMDDYIMNELLTSGYIKEGDFNED